jgi:hypothetical protein
LLIGIHVVFAIVYFFHTIMLCDNTEWILGYKIPGYKIPGYELTCD